MRKLFSIILITAIMISSNVLTSCGGSDKYSTTLTEDSSNPKYESYVGTYEFTDEMNTTWVLILNSDNTATIGLKGSDKVAYGSLMDWGNGELWVKFSDEVPMIWFPSGKKRGDQMPLVNGYLYYSPSSSDAKNPRNRLPVTKIK